MDSAARAMALDQGELTSMIGRGVGNAQGAGMSTRDDAAMGAQTDGDLSAGGGTDRNVRPTVPWSMPWKALLIGSAVLSGIRGGGRRRIGWMRSGDNGRWGRCVGRWGSRRNGRSRRSDNRRWHCRQRHCGLWRRDGVRRTGNRRGRDGRAGNRNRPQRSGLRRHQTRTIDFIERLLIRKRAPADDFGTNVVQRIGVVVDSLGSLGTGRTGMCEIRKANVPLRFGRAADNTERASGDGDGR